ncbi:MAG: peptidyl-prolyl cis-trans isomerase [Rhizobacter sp.]|nr:peptidyl-prolyl cis-trans isomerase [Rhizobacter sp.]
MVGALLFGIDHVVAARKDDPHLIVLGPEVDKEARTLFRDAKGREPSDAEMNTLRERWVDNEVLYREGVSLRVDQGDSAIRERVIFKALNVVQANLQPPKIDDATLRAWFETNRAKYGELARLDFLEAVLVGDASDDAVNGFVAALNRSASQGEAKGGLRVFKGRPRDNIVASFGGEFTAALEKSPLGTWRALSAKDGLHVVRLDAVKATETVSFDTVRGEVLQDWRDEQLMELRRRAVRDVGRKYTVKRIEAAK